jgi:hypothetical protein
MSVPSVERRDRRCRAWFEGWPPRRFWAGLLAGAATVALAEFLLGRFGLRFPLAPLALAAIPAIGLALAARRIPPGARASSRRWSLLCGLILGLLIGAAPVVERYPLFGLWIWAAVLISVYVVLDGPDRRRGSGGKRIA